MHTLLIYLYMIIIINLFIMMLPIFMSMINKKWMNKNLSFECGLNINNTSRTSFSLQFFMLMVLFIIFDIEITLLLMIPLMSSYSSYMLLFIMIFISILIIGLMYEWMEGSLNWKL